MASLPRRDLFRLIADWFDEHRRDLPWRRPSVSPWGVLVSEVMSQQTPVGRVAPAWVEWMETWPTPADLATADPADVLRAWGSLGYPRRALRLQECAQAITDRHNGRVPGDPELLRALPGIGEYTAAAVASFAFGQRIRVLDTNIRRVIGRVISGEFDQRPSSTAAERSLADSLLPASAGDSVIWNEGIMELGALICTARSPRCDDCPLAAHCTWNVEGRRVPEVRRSPVQKFAGTDRQLRGRVMKHLRQATGAAASEADLQRAAATDDARFARILQSLLTDRLVHRVPTGSAGDAAIALGPPPRAVR
ncbi:A/G-specific adenine glycosylase [Helcobacillus massiliensis]